MTDTKPAQLPDLLRILAAAGIDTAANKWHLTRRAIPKLEELAETPRLHKAVGHAKAATELMTKMLDELHAAMSSINTHVAVQERAKESAVDGAPPATASGGRGTPSS